MCSEEFDPSTGQFRYSGMYNTYVCENSSRVSNLVTVGRILQVHKRIYFRSPDFLYTQSGTLLCSEEKFGGKKFLHWCIFESILKRRLTRIFSMQSNLIAVTWDCSSCTSLYIEGGCGSEILKSQFASIFSTHSDCIADFGEWSWYICVCIGGSCGSDLQTVNYTSPTAVLTLTLTANGTTSSTVSNIVIVYRNDTSMLSVESFVCLSNSQKTAHAYINHIHDNQIVDFWEYLPVILKHGMLSMDNGVTFNKGGVFVDGEADLKLQHTDLKGSQCKWSEMTLVGMYMHLNAHIFACMRNLKGFERKWSEISLVGTYVYAFIHLWMHLFIHKYVCVLLVYMHLHPFVCLVLLGIYAYIQVYTHIF